MADALPGLVCVLAQPSDTATSTFLTKLLAHLVYVLASYLTRPACLLHEIDSPEQQPPTEREAGLDDSSTLMEECSLKNSVTDTSQMSELQPEVLGRAIDTVLPPQQQHRQLDTQAHALLVHEVLQPLASKGSVEQLLCQNAIQMLLPC